jgi:hypothetical protein
MLVMLMEILDMFCWQLYFALVYVTLEKFSTVSTVVCVSCLCIVDFKQVCRQNRI